MSLVVTSSEKLTMEKSVMQQKKFRLTLKAATSGCFIALFMIPLCGIVYCFGQVVFVNIANSDSGIMELLYVILGFLNLAIIAFAFVMPFLSIGRVIFSYLLLTDRGLEYRLWPFSLIRCTWDDVDQIKKPALPFQGEVLILKQADVLVSNLPLGLTKDKFGISNKLPITTLHQISGWKNGELRTELKTYATHLFIEQSIT